MHLNFLKQGKIEFLYSKDSTREKDGFISGILQLYIDDTIILEDEDLNDNPDDWKFFSFDIQPGMKEITWVYQKYNSEENKDMKMEIKVIIHTELKLSIVFKNRRDRICSFRL